jgi:predicted XRE-type DNA-binding protein
MARRTAKIRIERGSGNVFEDLGFPDPELERFKATLMLQIFRIITRRKLTQAEAGKVLGIQQPNVSRLMRGSSGSYSVERLMEFLIALGHNVEVVITPTRGKPGAMSVVVAA